MRKFTLYALLCLTTCYAKEKSKYPIHVPQLIDGNELGIDGNQIHNLVFIAKEVECLIRGIPNQETKLRVGKYEFNGAYCTIRDLSIIEKKDSHSSEQKQALHALLKIAKRDLLIVAEPFIEQGRSVKAITLQFLDEWATNHNRKNSFLLHWSQEEDGKEIETFNREVICFTQLYEFCVDLVSFISDLIASCPKALEQFKTMMKKKHMEQHAGTTSGI